MLDRDDLGGAEVRGRGFVEAHGDLIDDLVARVLAGVPTPEALSLLPGSAATDAATDAAMVHAAAARMMVLGQAAAEVVARTFGAGRDDTVVELFAHNLRDDLALLRWKQGMQRALGLAGDGSRTRP